MVCAHTLHNLDDAFDATKIKLRKLFQTIMNARDPNGPQIPELSLTNAQVAKAFGNSTGTRPGIVAPGLADFAAQVAKQQLLTPVYLVKGLAEAVDPCVKSMVQDEIPEIWGSIGRKVRPVNIFIPPFGSDPPLTPIGMVALSLNYLLPQEKQQLRQQACLDGDQYGSASYKDRYGQAANRAIIKRMDLIYQKSNTQTYEGALASTSITQSEKNI